MTIDPIEKGNSFSRRNGYQSGASEIIVREDAPQELRDAIVMLAYRHGLSPSPLRELICQVLLRRPDGSNWSEYPNIATEVEMLIDDASWFRVYDILEQIHHVLSNSGLASEVAEGFESDINEFMREHGIGWEMIDGVVLVRGSEFFHNASSVAVELMSASGKLTAAAELHEAISDLSRRPKPDVTGAVQHAMTALECVARELSETTDTLGKIVPNLALPKPLDTAVEKLWGFASQRGRHLSEGREPNFEDAELVVTVAAGVCTFLLKNNQASAFDG